MTLAQLRAQIADDAFAATFQTMGQYRTALLKTMADHFGDATEMVQKQAVITLRQAEALLKFFGGHDSEVALATYDGGLIAWGTEYPEEGSFWLGKTEVDDDLAMNGRPQAAHQQAAQGNARGDGFTDELRHWYGSLPDEATRQQAEPAGDERFAPCPFCGHPLHVVARKSNPYACCKTEGCKGKQLPLLNIDQPDDVAAWNRRAAQSGQRAGVAEDAARFVFLVEGALAMIRGDVLTPQQKAMQEGLSDEDLKTLDEVRARIDAAMFAAAPTPAAQGGVR